VYDGPIYAYNGLSPDQVTVNVQEQLARAGYYDGTDRWNPWTDDPGSHRSLSGLTMDWRSHRQSMSQHLPTLGLV